MDLTLSDELSSNVETPPALTSPPGGTGVSAPQKIEIWVSTGGHTEVDYCAMVLDFNGSDNIFVKVQSQDSFPGFFDTAAMYSKNNGSGWPGQTGGPAFFPIIPFDDAVISAEHDGQGNVTLRTPVGSYKRGGWIPLGGSQAGLGAFSSYFHMDNFRIEGGICDDFNRPNGTAGPEWTNINGELRINENRASGSLPFSLAVFGGDCGPACTGKEKIKSVKCKSGTLVVKTSGANPDSDVTATVGAQTQTVTAKTNGSASFKFKDLPPGPGSVEVVWDCAESAQKSFLCQ